MAVRSVEAKYVSTPSLTTAFTRIANARKLNRNLRRDGAGIIGDRVKPTGKTEKSAYLGIIMFGGANSSQFAIPR
ncbi:MAG: hypothetical protein C0485_10875 [Pirellula sp.]|nr:hypothetical protein [Pirellula sp.]